MALRLRYRRDWQLIVDSLSPGRSRDRSCDRALCDIASSALPCGHVHCACDAQVARVHNSGDCSILQLPGSPRLVGLRNHSRRTGRSRVSHPGIFPRYVALLLIPLIVGTIVTVHGKRGWLFSNTDGGWEYPAFWAAALLAVFLLGDGAATLVASPHLGF